MGMLGLTGFTTSSSELRSEEVTVRVVSELPESSINNTLQRLQPSSLWQSHAEGSTNLERSVLNGIIASLWATPSSAKTDEFSIITTSSTAKVGTPDKQIRLRALAYCRGIFLSLTTILFPLCSTISREVKSCWRRLKIQIKI